MDYSVYIAAMIMGLSILYLKSLPVNFLSNAFPSPNSADPVEMPPYAAFHFGLLFLPKYLFTGIEYLSVEQSLNKCFIHSYLNGTVNSEIFARVLFTRSFVKIKPSRKSEIILSYIDEGKS